MIPSASGFLSAAGPGPIILLMLSLFLALWGAIKAVPAILHALAMTVTTFERFVGTEDNPGVIDRLESQTVEMARQGAAIEDVQKKLNGEGSIQPALERLETEVGHLRGLAEDAAFQAKQARLAASDAHEQAAELSTRMAEQNDLAMTQRGLIEQQIADSASRLIEEMDDRTIEYSRRLMEHGGPDLNLPVPPHVHDVSLPHDKEAPGE